MSRETEKMAQEQERASMDYRLGHPNMGKQAGTPYSASENQNKSYRAPVRQRIYEALAAADRANQRGAAAQRAKDILDRVPEFAELLDALDQF